METNNLKNLIGRKCLVINPSSKKKTFEPATIRAVNVNLCLNKSKNTIFESISYEVILDRITIRKDSFFAEYHRQFYVSDDCIKLQD